MRLDEKQKWDEYYGSEVPVNPRQVMALGDELRAWFESVVPDGNCRVLEAGCGSGAQSLALAQNPRFDVHLLDSSEEALATARRLFAGHGLEAQVECGDLFDIGRPNYDLVFNSGVIEHYSFEDQVRMIRAMAMRSKGRVAVLAPNARCYWYWISRITNAAEGRWPFGAEMAVSHLADVFEAAGVELIGEKYLGRDWAGMFLANLAGVSEELKNLLLQCHASPLIADEQACYLYGAIGLAKGSAAPAATAPNSERFGIDALRAMAADALSIRISGESEISGLKDRLASETALKANAERANLLLERERSSLAAKSARDDAEIQRLAEQLHYLRDSGVQLEEARGVIQSFSSGIAHYQSAYESALSVLRGQRAWRLMLAIRKAYDLWTRHGLRGKAGALPLLLSAPFQAPDKLRDQEIQFPEIHSYVPDLETRPVESTFRLLAPLPRKYDVVILAIIDFDFRFQRPQQIAARFAQNGHRVFWISPTRFVPPDHEEAYFLRALRDNLWEVHLRGRQPDIYLGELEPQSKSAFEESLRQLYTDLAISENLILAQLPFWRALTLSVKNEHGSVLVYDCMDEWDSFENMGEFNRAEERSLVHECDLLLVTAERLRRKFVDRGLSPLLIRNGVDYDFFAGAARQNLLAEIPKPIVGYFGAIADWIDLDLVVAVANLRKQYSFVLIGQVFGRDTTALQALSNVHLLGNRPYETIPNYLREFDACTIPFALNDVTAATDPVKLYEYLAQGKPVVATDMAEIRPWGDLIYIARNAEDFACCLDQCLAETGDEPKTRRMAFAKDNTWESRIATIDAAVEKAFALASIVIVTHNSARYINPCIESILRNGSYPNFEIIVVDNASTDGTVEAVQRYAGSHASIRCESLANNRGFAAGNNVGARLARGEYLVLLNADTMVTPGWLGRLIWHIGRDASVGLICPTTNFAGNEAKIQTSYTEETSMEQFAAELSARARHARTDLVMAPLFCGLLRRQLYLDLDGLDEGYGIGMFEDDDLSEAVRARGLRVVVAEDCFVHHFGQGSFSKLNARDYNDLFDTNRKRFEDKWGIRWKPHRLRPGVTPPDQDIRFQPETFRKTLPQPGPQGP